MSLFITTKVFRTKGGSHIQNGSFDLVNLHDVNDVPGVVSRGLFNWVGGAWVAVTAYTVGTTKVLTKVSFANDFMLIGTPYMDAQKFSSRGKKIRIVDEEGVAMSFPLASAIVTVDGEDNNLNNPANCAAFVAAWNGTPLATSVGRVGCVDGDVILYKLPGQSKAFTIKATGSYE